MARPVNPYCPQCGASRAETAQHLRTKIEAYIEQNPRVYTFEMAHALYPERPSTVCYHNMITALYELGYVCVEDSEVAGPPFWVSSRELKKSKRYRKVTPSY